MLSKLDQSKLFCGAADGSTVLMLLYKSEDILVVKCESSKEFVRALTKNGFNQQQIKFADSISADATKLFKDILIAASVDCEGNSDVDCKTCFKVNDLQKIKLSQLIPSSIIAINATSLDGSMGESEAGGVASCGACVIC